MHLRHFFTFCLDVRHSSGLALKESHPLPLSCPFRAKAVMCISTPPPLGRAKVKWPFRPKEFNIVVLQHEYGERLPI